MKLQLVTLGCSKNRVDSEHLLFQIAQWGIEVVPEERPLDEGRVDVVVLNTCGFIQDAKTESVGAILEAVDAKERGLVGKILVFGCLSQRYRNELMAEIPEVDAFFGTLDILDLLRALDIPVNRELACHRYLTTPTHYAYLKISEGCDRHCAYCAIPAIRGAHI
ncbi:MAG: 30S ribosomal protein S12 methylthiotransferase RimO, partial [Bacteroidales bacterium]|nr:30S ribosomal protein S12 methylthiotransferase RimO [Bacteroidales bacterium]